MNQKEQNMTRKNFSSQDAPVVYLQPWLGGGGRGGLTRDHRETNNPDASLMVRKGWTRTQDVWITSPIRWPLGHTPSKKEYTYNIDLE